MLSTHATSLALLRIVVTFPYMQGLSRCLKLRGILRPCPLKLLLLFRPLSQHLVLAIHLLQLLFQLHNFLLLA